MDIYFGQPPRFHTDGVLGTERHDEYKEDFWNYMYRGILSFAFALLAFREDDELARIMTYASEFARKSGKNYGL